MRFKQMARKKPAAPIADGGPPPSLEELIKKLKERGQKRRSLTYEEINSVFENVEDVNPERIDELFEEIASMGIEIVDEQKEEKAPREETEDAELEGHASPIVA